MKKKCILSDGIHPHSIIQMEEDVVDFTIETVEEEDEDILTDEMIIRMVFNGIIVSNLGM